MPLWRPFKESGAHRHAGEQSPSNRAATSCGADHDACDAAQALFRAILRHARAARIDADAKATVLNVARNRICHSRHSTSKVIVTAAFRAGYEAVDLLAASARGDAAASAKIVDVLARIHPSHKRDPRPAPNPTKEPSLPPAGLESPQTTEDTALTVGEESAGGVTRPRGSIFDRPYPRVSGIRRVPTLSFTMGIPFLRTKKPQPVALSGYLGRRVQAATKQAGLLLEINNRWIPLAQHEDDWDTILAAECRGELEGDAGGSAADPGARSSWARTIHSVVQAIRSHSHREKQQQVERGERLLAILKEEERLARTEAKERRLALRNAQAGAPSKTPPDALQT